MSIVIPQVGDLVKSGKTLGVITGVGQFRGGDGEPTWGLLIDGKDWGGVEWNQVEGYAKTPKGNYKKKKGKMIKLRSHLVWNDKGYWTIEVKEGDCPLCGSFVKSVGK